MLLMATRGQKPGTGRKSSNLDRLKRLCSDLRTICSGLRQKIGFKESALKASSVIRKQNKGISRVPNLKHFGGLKQIDGD